jgi:23S rRNA pseudoU1915 N3-methylase RlmH
MKAFVDDTDVAVNDTGKQLTSRELAQVLQTDAQHWEKLLFTSGGKLELSKCFFYIMYWKFTEDGMPFLTPKSELSHKLMLQQ